MNRKTFIAAALVLAVLALPIFADPSKEELAAVDKYKNQSFDPKGLKKITTQENGWVQYQWTEGRYIYELASEGYRAVVEPSGLTIYRYSATNYSFEFPSGRVITFDPTTGEMTWTPAAGDPAPNFDLALLDGKKNVSLASLRGSVVLIDFFASWCGPCKEYMPDTQALHAKYAAKGLKVFGLDIEGNEKLARDFAKSLGVTFPVLMAKAGEDGEFNWSAQQIKDFGVSGIPHAVLIDKKGVIRAVDTVFSDTALLEKLLAE